MDDLLLRNPTLLTACCLLAGASLAPGLSWLPLPGLAVLVACGLTLGGRVGVALGALALGAWLWVVGGAEGLPATIEPSRPVTVVGKVTSPARCDADGRTVLPLRVVSLRQGVEVVRPRLELWLTVEGCNEPPVPGSRWQAKGLLRRSPGYRNASEVAPGSWRLPLVSRRFLVEEVPASPWATRLDVVRRRLTAMARGDGSPSEGRPRLLPALLLGERDTLDPRWVQGLRRAGLAHLLAVSGLHVAVLAGLVWLLVRPLPRWVALAMVALVVLAYLALLGPRPSILRSATMALLALGALGLERPPQGLNALSVAVVAMITWEPALVSRLGFRLSVAATAGIIALTPWLAERLPIPARLARWLAVPVAAQLATLPWILPLTGGVHPLAPILDLLAVPWLALYLGSGLVALGLSLLGWSAPLAWVGWLDVPISGLADLPTSPWLFLPLRAPTVLLVGALGWVLVSALRRHPGGVEPWNGLPGFVSDTWPGWGTLHRIRWPTLALLAALQLGARPPVVMPPEMVMFDVGQGDAVLLRHGSEAVLVDGGGWRRGDFGGRVLVPALVAEGVARLRAVVLTHPDRDHCAGLRDVARYLVVEEVWLGPGWEDDCAVELAASGRRGWRVLWAGDRRRVGEWFFEVLHPSAGSRGERNDRSLVLRATVGERGILLTGDIESTAERHLLRRAGAADVALGTTLLKVAHHGSKTSTTSAFLAALEPRVALVSAGRGNAYGHPAPAVLGRLGRHGVKVLRTDREGAIRWTLPHPAHAAAERDMLSP